MHSSPFKYPTHYCYFCQQPLTGFDSVHASTKYCSILECANTCRYKVEQAFGTILSAQFTIGDYLFNPLYAYMSCADTTNDPQPTTRILLLKENIIIYYPGIVEINNNNYLEVIDKARMYNIFS
jgi:hypothetical protein